MNINHKILGSITDIDTKKKKLKDKEQIKYYKNHNKRKVLKLKGLIPHAGYEYLWFIILFIISEILEYIKEITLWFQHNKNSKQDIV